MSESHHQLKAEAEAAELLEKPHLAEKMAARAQYRAEVNKGRIAQIWDELQILIRLASAWATGRYRRIPISTLMAVLAALVYFLMPLDSIPDFIWVVGFLDDAALIAKVFSMFRKDIEEFRQWELQESAEQEQDP